MATQLYFSPFIPAFSNIGVPIARAKLYFYYTATSTLAPVYADAAATVPLTNPVQANLAGKYPDVYLNSSIVYRVVQKDAADVQIGDAVDPYYPGTIVANVDSTIRADLLAPTGSSMVSFRRSETGAVSQTLAQILNGEVSVKDFGAIGDGTSHPVSEWVPTRFANLAAIQAVYPDVTALTDQIDYAAINKAIRVAQTVSKGVYIPAGTYLAWIKAWFSNVSIRGAGSACTTIKVPNGATHTIPNNAFSGPPFATGVPCVVDFNNIGQGNSANVMQNGHIEGLTLDGNVSGTAVPSTDLFGWGLTFTKYSNVTYFDIVAQNCHCGGLGTFINSNFHIGDCRVYNCGNSTVAGGTRPGFDVNSSKYCRWTYLSENCAYGARILDNCNNNICYGVVKNPTRAGFIFGNQLVNPGCWSNDIRVTVDGGCLDYAMTMGANCFNNDITVLATGLSGSTWRDIDYGGTGANNSHGNRVTVIGRQIQRSLAEIYSDDNDFDLIADQVNLVGPQGVDFAVNVFGDRNRIRLRLFDPATWRSRGLSFKTGAAGNILESFLYPSGNGNPYVDTDGTNLWVGQSPSWITASLGGGYGNAFGSPFPVVGYSRDSYNVVRLRGNLSGSAGTAFTLPAGFRPPFAMVYKDGNTATTVTVNTDGTVVVAGTGPWFLNQIAFITT